MHAGDIYLVCRLDGPKEQNKSAIFAVRAMLERSKRASDPSIGVNPNQAAVVIDDVPDDNIDRNRIFNVDASMNYIIYDEFQNQPPDVWNQNTKYDYMESFTALTDIVSVSDDLNIGFVGKGYSCLALLDRRDNYCTSQADLETFSAADPNRTQKQGIVAWCSYGCNGDEGRSSNYVNAGGPGGNANVQVR